MSDVLSVLPDRVKQIVLEDADCVFCHAALGAIGVSLWDAAKFLSSLIDFLGPRKTLVVPSLPFINRQYAAYVQGPIRYDVLLTPARVNILGETFRRFPGTVRSLNPLYTTAACGPAAEEIISKSHLDEMPFAPNTTYGRLCSLRTVVLGIGVNINTNAFIHLTDDLFLERYPFPIYSSMPLTAELLREGVFLEKRRYHYVLSERRKSIRPSRLHDCMSRESFYQYGEKPFPSYVYRLNDFLAYTHRLARESFADGLLPIWWRQLRES